MNEERKEVLKKMMALEKRKQYLKQFFEGKTIETVVTTKNPWLSMELNFKDGSKVLITGDFKLHTVEAVP